MNRLPSVYQGNENVANTTKSEPLSPNGNNLTNIQPQAEPVVHHHHLVQFLFRIVIYYLMQKNTTLAGVQSWI